MMLEGIRLAEWTDGSYFPSEDTMLLLRSLGKGCGHFLDVGTGTGIIGIRAHMLGYEVTCTDEDRHALLEAQRNAEANGVDLSFIECDLLDCVRGQFSVIAFNPPYLPEAGIPDRQLAGGPLGVETAMRYMKQAEGRIAPDGEVLVVLSSLGDTEHFLRGCAADWTVVPKASCRVEFETLTLFSGRLRHPVRR